MIRPDVIVSWPRNCDYPIWRQYIHDNRTLFNQVHIVFTETFQGFDYRPFVREAMFSDWCLFIDSPLPVAGEDWRNIAVNEGLKHSLHAEWLLFTEEDFFPKEGFWETVYQAVDDNSDVVGVMDGKRLHPCFLMVKRNILNATNRDFGIVPDKLDHFGKIQNDLFIAGAKVSAIDDKLYKHMNGLSHNFTLISREELPNYHPEEFNKYLQECLRVSVPQNDHFNSVVRKHLDRV